MTDHEVAMLVASVSADVADAFRPRLREVERESDRLLGEMRVLRRRLAARDAAEANLRAELAQQAARHAEEVAGLEARLERVTALLAESEAKPGRRPAPEPPVGQTAFVLAEAS